MCNYVGFRKSGPDKMDRISSNLTKSNIKSILQHYFSKFLNFMLNMLYACHACYVSQYT